MELINLGDWVVKIGTSKPSSGVGHRIIRVYSDPLLRTACGLELEPGEVLQNLGQDAASDQGLCKRCLTSRSA